MQRGKILSEVDLHEDSSRSRVSAIAREPMKEHDVPGALAQTSARRDLICGGQLLSQSFDDKQL